MEKEELVAEDFVYSIKRLADPKLQSTGWWVLDGKVKGLNEWREQNSGTESVNYDQKIEGLLAVDKYTLQFKLSREFPQFLYSLAMPFTFVVAKKSWITTEKSFLIIRLARVHLFLKNSTKVIKLFI